MKPTDLDRNLIQHIENKMFFEEFRISSRGQVADIFAELFASYLVATYVQNVVKSKRGTRTSFKVNMLQSNQNDRSKIYRSIVGWNKVNQLLLIDSLRADECVFQSEKSSGQTERIEKMVSILPYDLQKRFNVEYFINMLKKRSEKVRGLDSMGIGYVAIEKLDGIFTRIVTPKMCVFTVAKLFGGAATSVSEHLSKTKIAVRIKSKYLQTEELKFMKYLIRAQANVGADPSDWPETKALVESQGDLSFLDKGFRINNSKEFATWALNPDNLYIKKTYGPHKTARVKY